ncbi:hypothetical protein JFQ92_002296 [Edwardsiella piscicida]|nr:hypothetical protein [Edwardsiella piscicida]
MMMNQSMQDSRLSFEATGLLAMMLSLPDDWDIHKSWLQKQKQRCGRDKLTAMMKELIDCGYVAKKTRQREDGKMDGVDWEVYPKPVTVRLENRTTENPEDGKPVTTKKPLIQRNHITNNTPIVPTGDVCEEPNPIDDKPEKNTQAILTVFRHWQAEHNHPTAKLDQKRRKRINARLEEGFSPDELCKAISGAKYDAWLMGKNPSSRKYDGIETLLRDAAQVEKLRDLTNNEHAKAVATGEYSAVTASNLENIQRWLEREDEGAPI